MTCELTEHAINHGFFRLASHIATEHRVHAWLSCLTRLHEVESDQEPASGVLARCHGQKDDGSGNVDDKVADHDVDGLTPASVEEARPSQRSLAQTRQQRTGPSSGGGLKDRGLDGTEQGTHAARKYRSTWNIF